MNIRGCGVLLHITSLPSPYGIGDLGTAAYEFLDFLVDAGQLYWQILPLHPTDQEYDNSPYHALSAFACNPLMISPERMVSDGFIDASDISRNQGFSSREVDYPAVIAYKEEIFTLACKRFFQRGGSDEFREFCHNYSWWLDDYALFMAIRKKLAPLRWGDWPDELKDRNPDALQKIREQESAEIQREQFLQYIFSLQWNALRTACRDKGVLLIGDIPIYIDYDSADVWTNPDLFNLDNEKKPAAVAGVPPDYFSRTGQIWNSPVYNWEKMEKTGYSWWIQRIEHLISFVDYVRIDHFRGLFGFWEIPAGSDTALSGRWKHAKGRDLLRSIARRNPYLPVIAEDLGVITPDVREGMRELSIPGMKVLLFAFGAGMSGSPYIPHNIVKDCVVYTGTHDNNPVRGWYDEEAGEEERTNFAAYIGKTVNPDDASRDFIRLAMMSVANTVIIPMQDILNLGSDSRMNRPGTEEGNWRWRAEQSQMTRDIAQNLRQIAGLYDRV